jgi:hypothetical protein
MKSMDASAQVALISFVVMPEEMKCWVFGAGVVIPALSPKPAEEPSAALLRISGDRAHVRHALPRCDQDRHM